MNRLFLTLFLFLLLACRQNSTPVKKVASDSLTVVENQPAILAEEEKKLQALVPDYDTTQWTEIREPNNSILIDLKYATEDNFVKEKMYECARCFLRPVTTAALYKVNQEFQEQGLQLKLFDCYRPLSIQQRLWDKVPNASYVTPPSKGSMHNRGLAVDLTLVNADGEELDMGTPYDFFGRKAHHTCIDLPEEVLANRYLLKSTMEAAGFKSIRTEWWHYSFPMGRHGIDDMVWKCR